MALPPGFGSLKWAGLLHLNDQDWIAGGGGDGQMRSSGLKESTVALLPLSLLMLSDRDIWSYMYICILDKYLASCICPGIFTSGALFLPGLWLFKVKLPLGPGSPAGLLASGVPTLVPWDSQGVATAFIPLLYSICSWEAAFCRRLKEGVISHLWDGAEMPHILSWVPIFLLCLHAYRSA